MKKIIKVIGISICSLFLLGCLCFYIFIMSGWVQSTQDLWVTTAMTTLNHKWLATKFISEEKIKEIMDRNIVDDSMYSSNTELITITTPEPEVQTELSKMGLLEDKNYNEEEIIKIDKYLEEGYTKLEDGIYRKDVSDIGWQGYLLLVTDPSTISLAQTNKQYVQGQTVMQMVKDNNAKAGINAGGFDDGPNYDSNGGIPAGLLIVDGQIISPYNHNTTYKYNVIGFNNDNILVLDKMTPKEAIDAGIRDCVTFKPHLVINGEKIIKSGTGGWGIAPRTALGQRQTGEVIFFCVDGRQVHSIGVDIKILQDVLYDEGCYNVGMVDGGSSTVMIYGEEFINKPSLGHERWINNAWIVK